jgi:peptidoglycan/LPS O-acetylase OafA/YrhL
MLIIVNISFLETKKYDITFAFRSKKHMKYRPEIDGLRAIAILLVLFFHAGLNLFPAGFIGVDIFFVISGFLITTTIHDALQNNQFSLLDFYSRRLWRMQPIVICLLVFSTILTLVYYLPDDFVQYAKSARKTSLFISNVFFGNVTSDYFAPNSKQLPLLHTWSLSIEWQCYLILPFVIYLLQRFFAKETTIKVLYLSTLIFFILSLYLSHDYPAKTYYLFGSRVFEFLIGSCIAIRSASSRLRITGQPILCLIALTSILYIATLSHIHAGFPNYYALIVCLATGILIASGESPSQPLITRLLATKPMVFIGLISYSLYIWHWPVFAWMRYLDIEETMPVLMTAFTMIFIISCLSWRFIEKPTRKLHTTKFTYGLVILFILPMTFTHLSDRIIKTHEGYPQRFAETAHVYKKLKQYASPLRTACLQKKDTPVSPECLLGANEKNSPKGLMIGDSFSNHHWKFMDRLAMDAHVSILAHATVACLALPGIYQYEWYIKNEVYQACHAQTKRYYNMIKNNHYQFVILGENWNAYLGKGIINHLNDERSLELTQTRIEKALNKAIRMIIASGAKPVIIKPVAYVNEDSYACFLNHMKHRRKYDPKQCNFDLHPGEHEWFDALFTRMKNQYSELIIINPREVECPNGHCKADIHGVPVFRDSGHLTDYGSYQLGSIYLRRFKNPLS